MQADDFDLYGDLDAVNSQREDAKKKDEDLKQQQEKEKHEELVLQLKKENEYLETTKDQLKINMSSLLATARGELDR